MYPQHMFLWRNEKKNKNVDTLQPLYNTVHYNTVLDITRFKDGSKKCIDYMVIFQYNLYIFVWI